MAKEKEELYPTPPIGWNVVVYPGRRKENAKPALVYQVEERSQPGMIQVLVLSAGAVQIDSACSYAKMPEELLCGTTWDYPEGQTIPDSHFNVHRKWNAYVKMNAELEESRQAQRREEFRREQEKLKKMAEQQFTRVA